MIFSTRRTGNRNRRKVPEYILTPGADIDLLEIARYTIREWGIEQAQIYESKLTACFDSIASNSEHSRVVFSNRPDIRFVHCEHHYGFFVRPNKSCTLIVALLHERMDIISRIRKRLEG